MILRSITLALVIVLTGITVKAQDEITIDPNMFSPNYFSDLAEASKDPSIVHFLDISLQTPKLTAVPPAVYAMTNLKDLNMSFNRLASIGDEIANLTKLEKLNIEGNHYLTKISLKIGELKNLKELTIKDARMSAADLAALKAVIPEGCTFVSQ